MNEPGLMPPKGYEQSPGGQGGGNEMAWWQSASPGLTPIIEPDDDDDMYWFAFWLAASLPIGVLVAIVIFGVVLVAG